MEQMGLCRITIINKCIEYQCNFFIVPGNGLALLGISDCESLQLLSINCQTTTDQHERGLLMSKQSKVSLNQTTALKIIYIITTELNRK